MTTNNDEGCSKSLNKEIGPWGELEEDNNHLETYLIAMVM
jgi:hypothetical protein